MENSISSGDFQEVRGFQLLIIVRARVAVIEDKEVVLKLEDGAYFNRQINR
jgi:hypothetical protein